MAKLEPLINNKANMSQINIPVSHDPLKSYFPIVLQGSGSNGNNMNDRITNLENNVNWISSHMNVLSGKVDKLIVTVAKLDVQIKILLVFAGLAVTALVPFILYILNKQDNMLNKQNDIFFTIMEIKNWISSQK